MERNSTFIYKVLPAVITGILVTGAIVFAWQEAPCDPPGCNVSAPVNVSGTGQTKAYVDATHKGWLGVAADNYDSGYGLTVGYGGNKIGIKVRGNSYLQGATSDSSGAALRVVNDSYAEILYVRNDGRVGVGTTNPQHTLEIAGTGDWGSTAGIFVGNNGQIIEDSDENFFVGNVGSHVKINFGKSFARLYGSNDGDPATLMLENLDSLSGLMIGSGRATSVNIGKAGINTIISGNVGIGVPAPVKKLEVAGDIKIGNSFGILLGTSAADPASLAVNGAMYYNSANNKFRCYQNGWTDCITTGGSGGTIGGSGTANRVAKFTAATTIGNSQIFDNGANVSMGTLIPDANYRLTLSGGGIKSENATAQPAGYFSSTGGGAALLTGTGNVGIGINPAQKLEVANNTAIKLGNMYLSSGGNYAHLATNEWYNGSAWQQSAVGALIQINGQITDFFTHDVSGNHTRTLRLGSDGKITIPNLAGTGTRSVTVDSNGVLGTGVASGGNSFYTSIGNVDGLICGSGADCSNERSGFHIWRAPLGRKTRVGNIFNLTEGSVMCGVHRTGDAWGGVLEVKDVKIFARTNSVDVQIFSYDGSRCSHTVVNPEGHNDSSCTFYIPGSSFPIPAGIGYGVTYEAIVQWTCQYTPSGPGSENPEMSSRNAFIRYIWED